MLPEMSKIDLNLPCQISYQMEKKENTLFRIVLILIHAFVLGCHDMCAMPTLVIDCVYTYI